jgi:hypothetical protein
MFFLQYNYQTTLLLVGKVGMCITRASNWTSPVPFWWCVQRPHIIKYRRLRQHLMHLTTSITLENHVDHCKKKEEEEKESLAICLLS